MPPTELSRVLYRAIFRWARAADGVPFTLRAADLAEALPTLHIDARVSLEDSKAIRKLLRVSFRAHQHLQDDLEASEALEAGLKGLRLLNSQYIRHLDDLRSERSLHADRGDASFAVGQVFEHKQFGYRGVIYGWDARCTHEKAWADALGLRHEQPFYKTLPDEHDCQRVFGSVRITKYVAQENICPVSVPKRVTHRALEEYFSAFSVSRMRYVPKRQLQYAYPDDYEAEDAVSCREDTNILRLDDDGDPRDLPLRSFSPVWRGKQ